VENAVGEGLKWDKDVPVCNDVNECTISESDPCYYMANSQCQNTPGSYLCKCRAGFKNPPSNPSTCSPGSNVEGKVKFDEEFPTELWNPESELSTDMKGALKDMAINILKRILPEGEAIIEITRISKGSNIVEYDVFLFQKQHNENDEADEIANPKPTVSSEPIELDSLTKRMYDEWKPVNVSGLYLVPERKEFALTDKDECENGENDCSENADCSNTVGSFLCQCREGFRDDSKDADFPGRRCIKLETVVTKMPNVDEESDSDGKWMMIACGLLGLALVAAVLGVVVMKWKKKEKKQKMVAEGFSNQQEKPQLP